MGFPSGSAVNNLPAVQGGPPEMGLITESGRFPGEGHGYPLQDSCPENLMDRGAWRTTVPRVAKSWTQLTEMT